MEDQIKKLKKWIVLLMLSTSILSGLFIFNISTIYYLDKEWADYAKEQYYRSQYDLCLRSTGNVSGCYGQTLINKDGGWYEMQSPGWTWPMRIEGDERASLLPNRPF